MRNDLVQSDSLFQSRLRQQQSAWREAQGLAVGAHNGKPLGSRIEMPNARETLANFITPAAKRAVEAEIEREMTPDG